MTRTLVGTLLSQKAELPRQGLRKGDQNLPFSDTEPLSPTETPIYSGETRTGRVVSGVRPVYDWNLWKVETPVPTLVSSTAPVLISGGFQKTR